MDLSMEPVYILIHCPIVICSCFKALYDCRWYWQHLVQSSPLIYYWLTYQMPIPNVKCSKENNVHHLWHLCIIFIVSIALWIYMYYVFPGNGIRDSGTILQNHTREAHKSWSTLTVLQYIFHCHVIKNI